MMRIMQLCATSIAHGLGSIQVPTSYTSQLKSICLIKHAGFTFQTSRHIGAESIVKSKESIKFTHCKFTPLGYKQLLKVDRQVLSIYTPWVHCKKYLLPVFNFRLNSRTVPIKLSNKLRSSPFLIHNQQLVNEAAVFEYFDFPL